MKIIAIGDIHGRPIWAKIVAKEELSADKIVFVGDYFDTFEPIDAKTQIENFEMILEYKRTFPDKVVMLMGNHDYHYLKEAGEEYSGFQDDAAKDIQKVVTQALKEGSMQMCSLIEGYLFSHAGVTRTWLEIDPVWALDVEPLDVKINKLPLSAFKFNRTDTSGYGEHKAQGPIWVRPMNLIRDGVPGFKQVVGHTPQKKLLPEDEADFIFIDTLGVRQYLIIQDGKPSVGSV